MEGKQIVDLWHLRFTCSDELHVYLSYIQTAVDTDLNFVEMVIRIYLMFKNSCFGFRVL